jgi:hypothetical protein
MTGVAALIGLPTPNRPVRTPHRNNQGPSVLAARRAIPGSIVVTGLQQFNRSRKEQQGHYGKDSKGRRHADHPQLKILVLLRNAIGMDDASSHKRKAKQMYEPRRPALLSMNVASSNANGTYSAKFA